MRTRLVKAIALLFIASACGDSDPITPAHWGVIRVSVRATGGDLDLDGYDAVLDGARRQLVFPGSPAKIWGVPTGTHTLALDRVAGNCAVSGTGSKSVQVTNGDTTDVAFDVVCVATGISVTTRTSGAVVPPMYRVTANGIATSVAVNGVTAVGRLTPGTYVLELTTNVKNCSVAGTSQLTVSVRTREVTPVAFDVTCVTPIRVPRIAFVFDSLVGRLTTRWVGLVNLDGSGVTPVGPGTAPDWSPDGITLAYSDAGCPDYYYNFCGGGVVITDPETESTYRLPDGNAAFEPAYAPTRDIMAVVRCCGTTLQPGRLWILTVDGSVAPRLLVLPTISSGDNPAWSPDGERVAFSCIVVGSMRDICDVSRSGTNFRRLTTLGPVNTDPTWSPDGSRIAFSAGADVAIMSMNDRCVTRLTSGYTPAWSPDGKQLVVARVDGLYIVNADGTDVRRLTSGHHSLPAWRP